MQKNQFDRILDKLETAGNKLPDPVSLFFILCAIVMTASFICSKFNLNATHPTTGEVIFVENLFSTGALKVFLSNVVNIFQTFPPLGVVLVSLIGVGLADRTGLLEAILHLTVAKIPTNFLYITIILLGIIFSAVGDAGFVILPPLAGLIFLNIKKNPMVGIFLAFAASAAGFSAGLFVGLNDILVTSFTVPAGQLLHKDFTVTPALTLYFNIANVFVQLIVLTFITKKFIETRFKFDEKHLENIEQSKELTNVEKKALKYSGYLAIVYIVIIVILSVGNNAFLRDENGSLVSMKSPFMKGLIPIMSFGFFICGLIYGKIVGTIKNDKDAVRHISASLSTMGGYIFVVFASAQFIYLFSESKLGIVLAIKGASALQNIGLTGFPLVLLYVLLVAFINLFIGSASAKWAILSPIFVPMFMLLGFDTSLTQMAYRVGDSATNMISPLFPYVPLFLSFMNRYDKKAGLGTLIANMIPYAIASLLASIILLAIFVLFGLKFGL